VLARLIQRWQYWTGTYGKSTQRVSTSTESATSRAREVITIHSCNIIILCDSRHHSSSRSLSAQSIWFPGVWERETAALAGSSTRSTGCKTRGTRGGQDSLISCFFCRLVCRFGSFCISSLVYTVWGQYYSSLVIRFDRKAWSEHLYAINRHRKSLLKVIFYM